MLFNELGRVNPRAVCERREWPVRTTIGRIGNGQNMIGVTSQQRWFGHFVQVPNPDGAILTGGDKLAALGIKIQEVHVSGVASEYRDLLLGLRVPYSDGAIQRSRKQVAQPLGESQPSHLSTVSFE